MGHQIKYRPEIDGLRTIAVLPVIIYHAQLSTSSAPILPGGFFGVDVFFVISGFLITSMILKEQLSTGSFSLLNFYERRARRLLPGLLIVLLATLPAAWVLLQPTALINFSESLIASILFGSNIYWHYSLQEYGADSALYQPLLHTWSLAVEEQYYIVFPLLLLAIFRWMKSYLVLLLSIGFLASLLFAQWYTRIDQSFSFYMLPGRIWELLLGATLACSMNSFSDRLEPPVIRRFLPAAGLVMLFYSFASIDFEAGHPGFVTLLPVLGTALIIRYANARDIVTRLLSTRMFVWVGLISYSLYLWHYPIFSFSLIAGLSQTLPMKLVYILLTFALSILGYFVVEKPFRNRQLVKTSVFITSALTLSLFILAFSGYSILGEGLRERFPEIEQVYGINEFDNGILKDESWSILKELAAAEGLGGSKAHEPSTFEAQHLWFSDSTKKEKVLIIGDSLSHNMFNAFYLNLDLFSEYEFARFTMFDPKFKEQLPVLIDSPNFDRADILVFSYNLHRGNFPRVVKLLNKLEHLGKKIYMVSPPARFMKKDNQAFVDWYIKSNKNDNTFSKHDLDKELYRYNLPSENTEIDPRLRKLADKSNMPVLDRWALACNQSQSTCEALTPAGYKIYYDEIHWTLEGAKYFGQKIHDLGWLPSSDTTIGEDH